MAAAITETTYNVSPNLGGKVIKFKGTKAAQNDYIVFSDPVGVVVVNQADGTVDTVAYASMKVNDASGWAASDTTLTYDGATAAQLPSENGYIMCGSEIIFYTAGGATTGGNLTGCVRGCFGTTAASHSDNADVYILNTVVLGDTVTGPVRGIADVIEE